MAKCVHCQQRKGKRACPALSAEICSACCGEQRRVTIACPDSCVYLAGGRAVTAAVSADPRARIQALRDKLEQHCLRKKSDLNAALHAFALNGRVGVEPEWQPVAISYAFYAHRDAAGQRALDRFRSSEGRRLRGDELETLSWLENASVRLLEVEGIEPERGFRARDRLRDEHLFIHDPQLVDEASVGQLVLGWVLTIHGECSLEGAAVELPPTALPGVMACLAPLLALGPEVLNARALPEIHLELAHHASAPSEPSEPA